MLMRAEPGTNGSVFALSSGAVTSRSDVYPCNGKEGQGNDINDEESEADAESEG